MGRTSDLIDQEMADRQKRIEENTARLRLDEANRDAIKQHDRDTFDGTLLTPDQARDLPSQDDVDVKADLLKSGHSQAEVDDPFGIRGGKPRTTASEDKAAAAVKAPKSLVKDSEMAPRPGAVEDYQDAKNPRPSLGLKKRALARLTNQTPPSDGPAPAAAAPVDSGPTTPQANPLADLDKKNMQDRADLASAQSASSDAARAALAMSYSEQAMHIGTGVDVNKAGQDLANAEIDRPMQALDARRKMESGNLADAAKRYDIQSDMRQDDPNDPMARQAAALAVSRGMMPASAAKGFTLRTWKYMQQTGDYATAQAKAAEEVRWHSMEDATKRRGQDFQLMEARMREANRGAGAGAKLGDTQITALSNLKTAREDLNALATNQGGAGGFSTLWSKIPFTDANVWAGQRSALVDSTAAAMAGGKRPSVVLLARVNDAMPNIGDSEQVKRNKLANLDHMIRVAHDNLWTVSKQAGRNMGDIELMNGGRFDAEFAKMQNEGAGAGPDGQTMRGSDGGIYAHDGKGWYRVG